jgi:hypothetical protein
VQNTIASTSGAVLPSVKVAVRVDGSSDAISGFWTDQALEDGGEGVLGWDFSEIMTGREETVEICRERSMPEAELPTMMTFWTRC